MVRRGFDLVEGGSSAADFCDDLFGGLVPDEGLGVVVPVFGPDLDGIDEVGHAGDCHIRATVSLPIPNRLANDRVVQCVEVSSGVSSSVTRTTSATVPSGNHDRRPRPLAITPTPATPSSLNRLRHRRTASESTPQRRAISSLATPSAAHNSALAWTTPRCGSDVERAIFSNEPRSSLDTDNEGALFMTRTQHHQTISTTDH